MAVNMTADIHSHGKPCNMSRVGINIDPQRRNCSAKSSRADAQTVDSLQQLFLQPAYIWYL